MSAVLTGLVPEHWLQRWVRCSYCQNRLNNLLEKRLDLVRRTQTQQRSEFAGYSSDPISSMSDMSQQIYRRLGSPPLVQDSPLYRPQGHLGTTLKTST